MEERVLLVNGAFKIRSEPGVGTTVEVHVSLPEEARETLESVAG